MVLVVVAVVVVAAANMAAAVIAVETAVAESRSPRSWHSPTLTSSRGSRAPSAASAEVLGMQANRLAHCVSQSSHE